MHGYNPYALVIIIVNLNILFLTIIMTGLFFLGKNTSARWNYLAMKSLLLFIFLPVTAIIIYCIHDWYHIGNTYVGQPDFEYIENFNLSFEYLMEEPLYMYFELFVLLSVIIGLIKIIFYLYNINKSKYTILSNSMENQYFNDLLNNQSSKHTPKIFLNTNLSTSIVIGYFKPIIIVNKIYDTDWKNTMVLSHELTHIKRKDIYINSLINILACFYWYNPCIYIIKSILRSYCEESCDEVILLNSTLDDRKNYCKLITENLQDNINQKNLDLNLTFTTSNTKIIKRRIVHNMKYQNKFIKSFFAFLGVALLIYIMPTSTYAATNQMLESINDYYRTGFEEITYCRVTNNITNEDIDANGYFDLLRALNNINITLNGNSNKVISNSYLNAGDSVVIRLLTADYSDFYVTFDGVRYNSTDGILSKTFNISTSKSYEIKIGNPSGSNITINGSIDIKQN